MTNTDIIDALRRKINELHAERDEMMQRYIHASGVIESQQVDSGNLIARMNRLSHENDQLRREVTAWWAAVNALTTEYPPEYDPWSAEAYAFITRRVATLTHPAPDTTKE